MMRMLLAVTGMVVASGLFPAQEAKARVEHKLTYTKKQSYNAALRFLRVQGGYKIVEKDMESGYLLFEYPTRGSSAVTNGSIEVIERKSSVALVIQLPQMPAYHERMLASSLLKKLRADYGAPPKSETDKGESDDTPAAPESPDQSKKTPNEDSR